MDVLFDVDQFEHMKRPQLQKLCKNIGIKANSKTTKLISDLVEFYSSQKEENNTRNAETNVSTHEDRHRSPKPDNNATWNQKEGQETELSYKQQIMSQLEKKVQETLKESKIPRLNNRSVTFTVKTPNVKTPLHKKSHSAFKKMDSIDVYLEKKRKRTQSFYQNVKKAKTVASTARSIVAEMKATHTTPLKQSTRKMVNKNTDDNSKCFSFGHLKSPNMSKTSFGGFRFAVAEKPKTPARRKSVIAKENKMKTPYESRKSLAVTPYRFNATGNTTINSPLTTKQKFDLQASLSKVLPYKPHKGKLEVCPFVKRESKIPIKTKVAPNKQKVGIKNVKVTLRAERRQQEKFSRADKRTNAMLKRRGLAK